MTQGPFEFGFVVHLEERVESGELGGAVDRDDLIVGQAADDDQDAAGAGLGGFEHLIGVDHEVLADARQRALPRRLILDDLDEVLQFALEVFRLGQHGEAVRAGGGIGPSLGDGVDAFADLSHARRSPLDLGDHAETAGDLERLTEAGSGVLAGESGQFGVGDGARERGDFPTLGVHDFGQLVHWT